MPSPVALVPTAEPLVPVAVARRLLGRGGKPVAKQTVFTLGVRGEIDVRMVAGRFVVVEPSIRAYLERRSAGDQAA